MKNRQNIPRMFVLLSVAVASGVDASPTADDVLNAQNQATIAKSNADAASAAATMAYAQVTSQQTLLSAQLANQKNSIDGIQAALQAPDPAKLKMQGTIAAPTTAAIYNKILADQVESWLKGADETPAKDLANCSTVILFRPSLTSSTLVFKATKAKLFGLWKNLVAATQSVAAIPPVPATPPKPKKSGAPAPVIPPLLLVAGGGALANFILNTAAASKPQTGIGTQPITSATKIVTAAISSSVVGLKKPFYDPDSVSDVSYSTYGATESCSVISDAQFETASLIENARCLSDQLVSAQVQADKVSNLPAFDSSSKKVDPNALLRKNLETLNKQIVQATTDLQSLFVVDPTGLVPFNVAVQGEVFDRQLKQKNSCILSVAALSSDADSVARDGTFSSYKLSIATTTIVSWTIAAPDGQIKSAGFQALATKWKEQSLGD